MSIHSNYKIICTSHEFTVLKIVHIASADSFRSLIYVVTTCQHGGTTRIKAVYYGTSTSIPYQKIFQKITVRSPECPGILQQPTAIISVHFELTLHQVRASRQCIGWYWDNYLVDLLPYPSTSELFVRGVCWAVKIPGMVPVNENTLMYVCIYIPLERRFLFVGEWGAGQVYTSGEREMIRGS